MSTKKRNGLIEENIYEFYSYSDTAVYVQLLIPITQYISGGITNSYNGASNIGHIMNKSSQKKLPNFINVYTYCIERYTYKGDVYVVGR